MKKIILILVLLIFTTHASNAVSYFESGIFKGFDEEKSIDTGWMTDTNPSGLTVKTNRYLFFEVNNATYRLLYNPVFSWRFPYDFKVGQSYQIRFNNKRDRAYIIRPNGDEIKTKVTGIR